MGTAVLMLTRCLLFLSPECLLLRELQKQIVLSTKFPSPGDRFIWQWEIVTPKAGRKVSLRRLGCVAPRQAGR